MKATNCFQRLSIVLLFAGSASCAVATQFQTGRQALLLRNNPEEALSHFEQVAKTDPGYTFRSGPFHEGIWTYIGRAQYQLGRLPAARQSLERAVALDKDDYLARIYLGLALAKSGDRAKALPEIQTGLKGLYDWLEYLTFKTQFGVYWDPNREIRSQIEKDLTMIAGKDFDWQKLIADAEWVAKKMEDEVDMARRDEQLRDRDRDRFIPRRGLSVGAGF
jgi:tetratricopeptide (TPR) repeat protein